MPYFSINHNNLNINIASVICLVGVIFSIPLLTIGVVFFYFAYLHPKRNNKKCRYLLYFLLAFCISYLNLSKPVNDGDLGYYYWLYEFAGTKSFFEYISLIPKEPLFHIYNYAMNILTFGNFNLFLFVNTLIIYVLIMVSYDIICRHLGVDTSYAIFAALVLLLFSEFFFYTAQIIRQVLAGSVVFYGLTRLFFKKDRLSIFVIGAAGFIHASAFIFLIAYLFYFGRNIRLMRLIAIMFVCVLGYTFILKAMGNVLTDGSTLNIAINRGLSGSKELVSVGLLPMLVCLSVMPMACYIMYYYRDRDVRHYFLVPVTLLLFIATNLHNPLFILRFMEYIYMYIPITFTLTVVLLVSKPKLVMLLAVSLMFIRFALKLSASDFAFMSFSDFLLSGVPRYLLTIF